MYKKSTLDIHDQGPNQMSWPIILYCCLPSLIINRQAFFHVKAQFHPKMIVLFSKCRKFILLLPSLIHIIKRWFVGVSCLSYTWRINNTLFSTSRKAIKNGASLFFFFFWLIKSRCFICFGFWKNSCLNLCFFFLGICQSVHKS